MRTTLGIFLFELRARTARVSTWLFFAIFAFIGFMGVWRASVGSGLLSRITMAGRGNIEADAPYAIHYFVTLLSAYGLLMAAAFFGSAGSREFAAKFHTISFSYPVGKARYLGGRFAGALAATMIVLSGTGLGALLGTVAPWTDAASVGEVRLVSYVYPYLVSVLPNVIFAGALFFAIALLSRRFLPVWAGLSGMAVLHGVAMGLMRGENRTLAALVDPSGLIASRLAFAYWPVAEKNEALIPFAGLLLANRLLWLALAAGIGVFAYWRFSFSVVGEKRGRVSGAASGLAPVVAQGRAASLATAADTGKRFRPGAFGTPPRAERRYGLADDLGRAIHIMREEFLNLTRRTTFYVILALGLALVLFVGTRNIGIVRGTQTFPVTSQVLEALTDSLYFLGVLLILFCSGALAHREKDARVHEIFDSCPVPVWVPFLGKLGALVLVVVVSLVLVMVGGMAVQAMRGYFRFELGLYAKELFGVQLVRYSLIAALAVFAQVLAGKRILGYLITFFFVDEFFEVMGLEHHLWTFASTPGHTISDMNGFGPYASAIAAYDLYWVFVAVILVALAVLLYPRGVERGLLRRLAGMKGRWSRRTGVALLAGTAGCCVMGGWIVYNTTIMNRFETAKSVERHRAAYERAYKSWERSPQPHVVGIQSRIDLYPEERRFAASGEIRLTNRGGSPVETLFVQVPEDAVVRELRPEAPSTLVSTDSTFGVRLFALRRPLGPGEATSLHFRLERAERGFRDRRVDTRLVENGAFLTVMDLFPATGYDPYAQTELDDNDARGRQGLPPKPRMAPMDDERALMRTPLGAHADWIDFDVVVSTTRDQVALAPGELVREWEESGRRFYRYLSERKILRYVAVLSGRYDLKRVPGEPDIEVYYHPDHEYNVDLMADGVERSLEYFTKEFGPYPFGTVRIVEFPRYEVFAEAFAGLIPLSEGYGFIARYDDRHVKEVFRVMAHEVGHQWWGHQIFGADVEGFYVLTEVMAQYSALCVSKGAYPRPLFDRYVRYEIDRYLRGRGTEVEEELPLARTCQETWYGSYAKGFVVMNALAEYIGEERLNEAIRGFIAEKAFQGPPFPTSRQLIERLRAAAPDSLKYLVDDSFERIVLFDNEALEARCERDGDGYVVTLAYKARKWEAGADGKESPLPLHDLIEFAVFDNDGAELCKTCAWVMSETGEIRMEVDRLPARVGIDPHYLLVDTEVANNVIAIEGAAGS